MMDKTNLRIETVNEYCIVDKDNQIVKDGFCSEEEAAKWLEDVYGIKHEPKPQPKIGGWIPCSERLPEDDNDFIVTFRDGECVIAYLDDSDKWINSSTGAEISLLVVAWQPLPESYHG